jgi:hypothetical protein
MSARCKFNGQMSEVLGRGDHIRIETLVEKQDSQSGAERN